MTRARGRMLPVLAATALLATGCHRTQVATPIPDPRVVGDRIVFPSDAPQLGALSVVNADPEGVRTARFFGHLVWDEDLTVRVFTPFAGRVRRVLVGTGCAVAKGTALAEIESPDYGQAQADARTAQSAERLAASNLTRLRELYENGAAPLKELEAAEAESTRATAERERAQARLAPYGAPADSVDGVFLLRSPIAGTLVERNVTPGQETRPDQMLANAPQFYSPLFVLSDPTRLWIELDASEADLGALAPGTRLEIDSSAFTDRHFEGRLDVVSEAIDPVTHTLRARGTVPNPDRQLKAEMFVSVHAPTRASADVSVPAPAVFLKGDRHYVFVEEQPGTFVRRQVDVHDEHDDRVLISAGVHAAERVVTEGCVLLEQLFD